VPPPKTDAEFAQHLRRLLPLFFYDPQKNLPLLHRAMEGPISAWASHAQAAADRLPAADQTAGLVNIRAQTPILVGMHDWTCPVVSSERLHAGIRNSDLVERQGAGH
jgi:pimeloyl-ACP methyl ester carboxylesterase